MGVAAGDIEALIVGQCVFSGVCNIGPVACDTKCVTAIRDTEWRVNESLDM